jgi:hypothetical protein
MRLCVAAALAAALLAGTIALSIELPRSASDPSDPTNVHTAQPKAISTHRSNLDTADAR